MGATRLDLLLLEKNLASTRTKAQELIREGKVKVDGRVSTKAGEKVGPDSLVELLSHEHPYVSRGGLKLAAALEKFSLSVANLRVLDVGQSTGGFTQCLLLAGASAVVGVEVGHGQLAPTLVADSRVQCIERQDIRDLPPETLRPVFPFCVADLSFISLTLVLPHLPLFLEKNANLVVLVKPQFEVGPGNVGSGGIVRDAQLRAAAVARVKETARQCGFTVAGEMESPIEGGDGNQEFLLHLRWLSS